MYIYLYFMYYSVLICIFYYIWGLKSFKKAQSIQK